MPPKSTLTTCTVEGCERPFYGRGMCRAHYGRWRRGEELNRPFRIHGDDLSRFFSKIGPPDENGCRLWQGQKVKGGYGMFKRSGGNIGAHRYAYELAFGPIPDGLVVCHSCDTPPCCEPSHLFLGTHKDNKEDCLKKERMGANVLSYDDVRRIRQKLADGESMQVIADQFGVHLRTIGRIATGETWKWLR